MNFHTQKGFTLVETLVGTAVFVIVALVSYRAFGVLMDAVASAQAKIAAISVANERFEIIRNLPYGDVGIIGGLPDGNIARNQTTVRDGYSFAIVTTIRNVDDEFDGTIGGSPSDTSPADYKLVDLDITCTNCKYLPDLNFTTLVAPHALETASTNGALFIQVFDAAGIPVPNTSLHIVNTQPNPDIVIDDTTDDGGWVKIVDAPPGTYAYNLTATKAGYTTDQTYPAGGAAGPSPVNQDSTVVIHLVTQTSLTIDRVSTLAVSTIDAACVAVPNVPFSLTGTKLIGLPSVLKYPLHNFSTNSAGTLSVPNMEWDTYDLALTTSAYDLAGGSVFPNFDLDPNQTKVVRMFIVPHVEKALLVSVMDSTGNFIEGATVQLQKTPFNQTKTTPGAGDCLTPGQVFWNGLENGTYTLTVSKEGYADSVSTFSLASGWQNKNIILTP